MAEMKMKEKVKIVLKGKAIPYLKGFPGTFKTATADVVADELGKEIYGKPLRLFDIRLSQMDSAEVIGMPVRTTIKVNGVDVETMTYAKPAWAVLANSEPSLILFSEANRATLETRNAALQILNERRIGFDFFFNENVYMMMDGNLGSEDGTEVETFDTALNGRLIHCVYPEPIKLFDEWIEGFAKANITPHLLSFLSKTRSAVYKMPDKNDKNDAYPSYRTWTFLSNIIKGNLGDDAEPNAIIKLVTNVGSNCVGDSAFKFIEYLKNLDMITIEDIVNATKPIATVIKKLDRSRKSELLLELKNLDAFKWDNTQLNNVINFLNSIEEDERMTYLQNLINTYTMADADKKATMKNNLKIFKDTYTEEFKYLATKIKEMKN